MKRSRPEDLHDTSCECDRPPKAILRHHALRHRQPGADTLCMHPQDDVLIDHQLHKAICLALHAAGFSSVTRGALSSFRDLTQEYMHHFALRVNQSMRSCRRSKPTPQDFIFALSQFSLTPSSLAPDLSLNPPPNIAQAPILPSSNGLPQLFEPSNFIPREERSQTSSDQKAFIPTHFPGFPSKHAYTETPVFPTRETDAFKIRERSTQEGSQAEQALRTLIAANKASEKKQRQRAGKAKDSIQAQSEQVWAQALDAMASEERVVAASGNDDAIISFDGTANSKDEDSLNSGVGRFANYDRLFWRKPNKTDLMRAA